MVPRRAVRPPLRALLTVVLAVVLAATTSTVAAGPSAAAEPTVLRLTAPPGYDGGTVPIAVVLETAGGAPVAGAEVVVERYVAGVWTPIAAVVTDAEGTAAAEAERARDARENLFRAIYAGDATYEPARTTQVRSRLLRRRGVVTLTGPDTVVDERSVRLAVRWRTGSGDPVAGEVRIQRRTRGDRWKQHDTLATGADGRASFRTAPRVDTSWRVLAPALDWVAAARSEVHRVDNLPPGEPVRMPKGAPRPRVSLPPQPRASGDGARAVVLKIPAGVWSSMTGRSWHSGCPVGRAGLRLLRVNYWGYDGYRYRGEVVAATGAVDNMARALTAMYQARLPIRALYRVDRFGWSERLQGANDYRSMAAGNTSGFNCRWVVNRPGVRSPHSYGRSLDVNPWENPYRSATGLVPNSWWQAHSHPRVAWRSRTHRVVRIFLRHGFSWTYGTGDSQHFDVRGGSGRVAAPNPRLCDGFACH